MVVTLLGGLFAAFVGSQKASQLAVVVTFHVLFATFKYLDSQKASQLAVVVTNHGFVESSP